MSLNANVTGAMYHFDRGFLEMISLVFRSYFLVRNQPLHWLELCADSTAALC